jgi:hypothetical protein
MLNALLKDALNLTFCGTDVSRNGSHLNHINLAQKEEERYNTNYQTSQSAIHMEEIEEGTYQTKRYFKQRRESLCDARRYVAYISLQAVQGIATMSVFLSIPFALKEMGKYPLLQDVLRTNAKQDTHPLSGKTESNLAEHDGHKRIGSHSQTSFCAIGRDIYRPLCSIDEGEVEDNRQNADESIQHSLQPQTSRRLPKPNGQFANGFRHT